MQGFADAQDRPQAGLAGGDELLGHQLAVFLVVLPALGMADQHVAAADVMQHAARDLAGVGALLVQVQVLGPEGQALGAVAVGQFAEVGHGGQDHQVHAGRPGRGRHGVEQVAREGAVPMQFPVARDDSLAHPWLLAFQGGKDTAMAWA